MNNTLSALNNYLFEQIERLNDDSLSGEELKSEIARTDCISRTAKAIIQNGELALKAKEYCDEYDSDNKINVPFLEMGKKQ